MSLYPGGLISGITYSLANEWAYTPGGGGALKWDLTVFTDTQEDSLMSKTNQRIFSNVKLFLWF